jgi:hypothetical protein
MLKCIRNSLYLVPVAASSLVANAAVDPLITASLTTATTAFTDNFGAVAAWFVGVVVTITALAMLIKFIRKAK